MRIENFAAVNNFRFEFECGKDWRACVLRLVEENKGTMTVVLFICQIDEAVPLEFEQPLQPNSL